MLANELEIYHFQTKSLYHHVPRDGGLYPGSQLTGGSCLPHTTPRITLYSTNLIQTEIFSKLRSNKLRNFLNVQQIIYGEALDIQLYPNKRINILRSAAP